MNPVVCLDISKGKSQIQEFIKANHIIKLTLNFEINSSVIKIKHDKEQIERACLKELIKHAPINITKDVD
ncbi:hypothetical protein [Lysinibacillus boronitolerans]|uniref:hypothetical protein n=1 Tax=Lysinibacillus boronitolerans TaxID=309788 RepID=UPI003853224A